MLSDDPLTGPGTHDPGELLEVAESVVKAAPDDPESWLMLGYAREAMAWGLGPLGAWPRFPWNQVHPAVRNLRAWQSQDPAATFPQVRADSIDMKLWELFTNFPPKKAASRSVSESGRVMHAHKSLLSRIDSGQAAIEIRADAALTGRALNDTRLKLLQAAWEAYERAAKLRPHGQQLEAFEAAIHRFSQLRWFRIPSQWTTFGPSILSFVPIKQPSAPFDVTAVLSALESSDVDQWRLRILHLESELERFSPGFQWTAWSWEDGEAPGFWESDLAARLGENVWAALQKGFAQFATRNTGRRYSFSVPDEVAERLSPERPWARLPLEPWFDDLSHSFKREGHVSKTTAHALVDLLILHAVIEYKRGRIGDAYPAMWLVYFVELAGHKAGLPEHWIENAYRWHWDLDKAWEETREILDAHPDLEFRVFHEVE